MRTVDRQTAWPKPWSGTQNEFEFRSHLNMARAAVLMLDYDGTLAPFKVDKMRALPYPGIAERLERILAQPKNRLVLVTGRPAAELKQLLPVANKVEIWGSHGREHLLPDGSYELNQITPRQKAVLDAIEQHLRATGHGESIERKPASLAIHWRMLSLDRQQELQLLSYQLFERFAAVSSFQALPFEAGLEFRTGDRTKADAVRETLSTENSSPMFAAYLGDDATDEDAFDAMRGRGLSLLVREEARATQADFWLHPPEDLLAFLDCWIEAAELGDAE